MGREFQRGGMVKENTFSVVAAGPRLGVRGEVSPFFPVTLKVQTGSDERRHPRSRYSVWTQTV